jgi:hypothetical protein
VLYYYSLHIFILDAPVVQFWTAARHQIKYGGSTIATTSYHTSAGKTPHNKLITATTSNGNPGPVWKRIELQGIAIKLINTAMKLIQWNILVKRIRRDADSKPTSWWGNAIKMTYKYIKPTRVWFLSYAWERNRGRLFAAVSDGNKSLYLVFVGVVFSQHLVLLLEQLGQHLELLLEQLGQQHLGCFLGQQDISILTAFRTAVSIYDSI